MISKYIYESKIGKILIVFKNHKLVSLQFLDTLNNQNDLIYNDFNDVIDNTIKWLNDYFLGVNVNLNQLDICLEGTEFQKLVWQKLLEIPYGTTTTYKDIALKIKEENNKVVAYQAVGKAIANNTILIVVPCHRVIGKNNKLVGYKGGLERKKYLLQLERNHFKP